ncbi:hypothetical protein GBAR_LOCUS26399 [Geodia barretti]|uniref:Uncharacterized protein n=1 Tax=Geodia barretti TaxID=519541 RepID=A0AA35X6Z6_GEOBA|nr:hypothetical protein GBAR_LOCUS26399 [Geodia barretti]
MHVEVGGEIRGERETKRTNAKGVKRQAYQGGTFVGNHVHKLLKVNCLCTSCVESQCAQQPNSIEHIGNKILREGQERGESMEKTVKGVI